MRRLDREYAPARADDGAGCPRGVDRCLDRGLWAHHACLRVPQADVARIEPRVARPPPSDLVGIEPLDRRAVLARRGERALDEAGSRLADRDAAGLEQQLLVARSLELAPQLPGSARDRREVRMLEASDAEQPRPPVRAAPRAPALVLIDPDHVEPSGGQLPRGARPDRAQPEHRGVRVEARHRSRTSAQAPALRPPIVLDHSCGLASGRNRVWPRPVAIIV